MHLQDKVLQRVAQCSCVFSQGVFEFLQHKGQAPTPQGLQVMLHGQVPTGKRLENLFLRTDVAFEPFVAICCHTFKVEHQMCLHATNSVFISKMDFTTIYMSL